MKPIKLPEPPPSPGRILGGGGVPDIFEGGVLGVVRRAVIIGNGFSSSENQSIGLVKALGLYNHHTIYRVTRPRGGINELLLWLPVSIHQKLYYILKRIYLFSQVLLNRKRKQITSIPYGNGGGAGLASILEADVRKIVRLARESFEKEGPLLVIASGRDTISVASSIKRLASDNVFVVQIQHPRSHLERFDLVITPQHDYYPLSPRAQEQVPRVLRKWITPQEPPDKHVILTMGALHQLDSTALRNAAVTCHEEFAPLPKPILVVNIGGPIRKLIIFLSLYCCLQLCIPFYFIFYIFIISGYCRYGADLARQLTTSLHSVLDSCGSVRISFSRRTPEKVRNVIKKELGTESKIHIWNGEGPNPHMGNLAWADAFIVTADSVSMLSEVCSTGKPVYVLGSERCTWKFMDFHRTLREKGVVRPFTGLEDISESWSYPPLNDTAEAANQVHKSLAERGWKIRV